MRSRWVVARCIRGALATYQLVCDKREMRRVAMSVAGVVALSATVVLTVLTLRETSPRNLVIISLDDLRADRLGVYGHHRPTSPNIDRIAVEGAVFTDAVTQFTSTLHSHRALFTGRYHFHAQGYPLLAQILAEHGFTTAGFTGGGYLDRRFGLGAGFATYVDEDGYSGLELSLPRVEAWLRERDTEKPFFLFLHTYDVHCPFAPPEPYRSMFLNGRTRRFEIDGKCDNNYFNHITMTPEDYDVLRSVYDGGIRWTDERIGEFLAALHASDVMDDTLIVILSDHGERLGEHGDVGHGDTLNVEQRVPLVFHGPRVPRGRFDSPAQLVDVVPTVLDAFDIDPPHAMDGVSLWAWIREDTGEHRSRVRYTESVRGHQTLRVGSRWKIVRRAGSGTRELYDLAVSPDVDVSADHPEVLSVLTAELDGLLKKKPARPAAAVPMDSDLRERLRELGYLD